MLSNPARLPILARWWIAAAAVVYLVDLLHQTRSGLTDGVQRPFGDDFVNYWSGAFLALHGRAGAVYDLLAFHGFEQSVVGQTLDLYHYSYPPIMLLLSLPLALLPYVPALAVWLIGSWYAFYRALRIVAGDAGLLLSLATPALFVNAIGGQNGALTAALLGGGLVLLDRRPITAGVLLGLLAFKPQLAIMLPVALLAGWRWRTIAAGCVTVVALIAASTLAFGHELWSAYADTMTVMRVAILENGTDIWRIMVSVFVFMRKYGAGLTTAYAAQAVSAAVAAGFVAWSWWRNHPAHIRNAMVVIGTWLATPYLQDYDLVVGAFVAVWLHREKAGWVSVRWIRAAIGAILLLPVLAASIGKHTDLVFGPLLIIPVMALLVRLAAGHDRAQRQAATAYQAKPSAPSCNRTQTVSSTCTRSYTSAGTVASSGVVSGPHGASASR
jgi:Glycosyltransferase family 87